jgi:hypothetical protein
MMTRTKCLLLMLLVASFSFAQSKKIQAVNNFSIRNAGTIKDKNYNVDGYYFFYAVDKLKKGQLEYNIDILDNNLTSVAQKTYVDDKSTVLMSSAYNNQAMMFAMANFDKKFIKLISFDKQANQKETVEIPLEKGEIQWYSLLSTSSDFVYLMSVDDKGFLFNRITDNNKLGYSINYYPTDGGKAWQYQSDPKSKEWLMANLVEANQDYVVVLEYAKPGMLSQKANLNALVLDAKTGKLIFKKEYVKKTNPRTITNAMLTGKSVIFMGEYFKPNDNTFKDKGIGIYGEEIDMAGQTINESLVSWDKDVDPMLKETGNSEAGYVMFHKIVRTGNGDLYAIGERYQKNTKGAGAVGAIVGLSAGTMLVTDGLFFKFDSNMKLKDIKKFEKGKSTLPRFSAFSTPQVNAAIAKFMGGFDYGFTQTDPKNDRFYSMFLDSERAGVKSKNVKYAYKTIIYDEGEFTEDKITLSPEESADKRLRLLPAKVGYVTLIDFDEKAKEVNVRLEKVNIK